MLRKIIYTKSKEQPIVEYMLANKRFFFIEMIKEIGKAKHYSNMPSGEMIWEEYKNSNTVDGWNHIDEWIMAYHRIIKTPNPLYKYMLVNTMFIFRYCWIISKDSPYLMAKSKDYGNPYTGERYAS